MTSTADAVVIGAGVLGCSIAYALARRGVRVVVVDGAAAPGMGSTSASAAIVRFHYSTFDGTALAWDAKFGWESWRDYLRAGESEPLAHYERTGMLVLDTPDLSSRAPLPHLVELGVPADVLGPDDIRRRFPGIDPGAYAPPARADDPGFDRPAGGELGAFFTADGGFVDDPVLATVNLHDAAMRAGAMFRFGRRVSDVIRVAGRVGGVVLVEGERIAAPVVVNVAGPHSYRVNAIAGVADDFPVPTRPLRQEVHLLPAPADYSLAAGSPYVTDADQGVYFGPQRGDVVIVGGLEPACDPFEWVDDPDAFNPAPTLDNWETYTARLGRRLPGLRVPNRPAGHAGLYDVSADWLPTYDRTSLDGFYVAIGSSGNQFKNAPTVGPLIAALVDYCEGGADHDAAPLQARLPHLDRTIDLAVFSRLRAPAATSLSVLG